MNLYHPRLRRVFLSQYWYQCPEEKKWQERNQPADCKGGQTECMALTTALRSKDAEGKQEAARTINGCRPASRE